MAEDSKVLTAEEHYAQILDFLKENPNGWVSITMPENNVNAVQMILHPENKHRLHMVDSPHQEDDWGKAVIN